jgi:Amt family ammonium transporter
MLVEGIEKGKPSLLGIVSGAVAGLVAVTPASGLAGPMGALVLGLVAGPICYLFCSVVKNALGYDDALDVFGIHCIGGIIGALGTAIVANPAFGGTGVYDYALAKVGDYNMFGQLVIQMWAVAVTLLWSGIGSAIIFLIIKAVVGLRLTTDQEREGLDIVDHGERAYNY